jgi:hypothetical protein
MGGPGSGEWREGALRVIRDGLSAGAGTVEEQIAYLLRVLGPVGYHDESQLVTDELAQDIEDALIAAQQFRHEELALPSVLIENLSRADALLSEWSGPDRGDFWFPSGLRTHRVWEEVRALCREALAALDDLAPYRSEL